MIMATGLSRLESIEANTYPPTVLVKAHLSEEQSAPGQTELSKVYRKDTYIEIITKVVIEPK